jgi:hypothetical protein
MKQIKVINRIPSSADQIERETAKLFTPAPLEKFVPFILLGFWGLLLFSIFSS